MVIIFKNYENSGNFTGAIIGLLIFLGITIIIDVFLNINNSESLYLSLVDIGGFVIIMILGIISIINNSIKNMSHDSDSQDTDYCEYIVTESVDKLLYDDTTDSYFLVVTMKNIGDDLYEVPECYLRVTNSYGKKLYNGACKVSYNTDSKIIQARSTRTAYIIMSNCSQSTYEYFKSIKSYATGADAAKYINVLITWWAYM